MSELKPRVTLLSPEEKEELREWLGEHDTELETEWAKVAEERLRGIKAGERKTIDAFEVFAEARRIAER